MTEQKLKELLADMTLEEKVNQMSQVVGAFFNKDMDITAMGPMADKGFNTGKCSAFRFHPGQHGRQKR